MIHQTSASDQGSNWRKPHLPAFPDLPSLGRWLSHNTSAGRAVREDADSGTITERVLNLCLWGWGWMRGYTGRETKQECLECSRSWSWRGRAQWHAWRGLHQPLYWVWPWTSSWGGYNRRRTCSELLFRKMSWVTKQKTDERREIQEPEIGGHSNEGSKDTFSRRWGDGEQGARVKSAPEVIFTGFWKWLIVEGKKAGVQEAHTVLRSRQRGLNSSNPRRARDKTFPAARWGWQWGALWDAGSGSMGSAGWQAWRSTCEQIGRDQIQHGGPQGAPWSSYFPAHQPQQPGEGHTGHDEQEPPAPWGLSCSERADRWSRPWATLPHQSSRCPSAIIKTLPLQPLGKAHRYLMPTLFKGLEGQREQCVCP